MRNLKRALSLGLTAAMISGLMVMGSSAASYADVADTDNVEAIEVLQAVGIMVGDNNGEFNPDQNVTRNEMAVIMSNLMEYNVASYKGTSPFVDVPSWAEPYVAACYTNGITAGTSATTYGGSNTVTTAQAALMLMKALGYFQYAQDFGSDWQLATVRQGNAIDLFVGVDSGVTQAMTRNDVAQLVLNTLEAGTVKASTSGSITVGGVTINTDVKYDYITSGEGYATSIDNKGTNIDGDLIQGSVVELGEQLYMGDLTKDKDADAFGRPAVIWSYKDNEIGTYVDARTQTWTTKVTERDLYRAAGTAAVNDYAWTIWVDGDDVDTTAHGEGYELDRNDTERWMKTGNGVLTEMFVDTVAETVDVTIINTYVGQVTRVEPNEDSSDYAVTVSFETKPDGSVNRRFNTETEFAQDDIVVMGIANGVIETMDLAEVVEGTVSSVKDYEFVGIDESDYDYNYGYTHADRISSGLVDLDGNGVENPDTGDEIALYLDLNGCAVAMADTSATAEDYLYVKGTHEEFGNVYAEVVYYDGQEEIIEIDEIDGKPATGVSTNVYDPTDTVTALTADGIVSKGVYQFSRSGDEYDLTSARFDTDTVTAGKQAAFTVTKLFTDADNNGVLDAGADAGRIENGHAIFGIYDGANYTGTNTANDNTVYVDAYHNATFVGYRNVPTMTDVCGYSVVEGNSGIADIVFIINDVQYELDNDSFFFISSTNAVKRDNDGKTWTYDVTIEGEEQELVASTDLSKSGLNGMGFYQITKYDSKEMVTEVEQVVSKAEILALGHNAYATSAEGTTLILNTVTGNVPGDKTYDPTDVSDSQKATYSLTDETMYLVAYMNKANDDVDGVDLGNFGMIRPTNRYTTDITGVYVLNEENGDKTAPTAKLVLIVMPNNEATVSATPSAVTISGDKASYQAGDSVTLTVNVAGIPLTNVTYQWYEDKDSDGSADADEIIAGATGSTYTLASVATTDNGKEYLCVVTNTDPEKDEPSVTTSTSYTLNVGVLEYFDGVNKDAVNGTEFKLNAAGVINSLSPTLNVVDGLNTVNQVKAYFAANGYTVEGNVEITGANAYKVTASKDGAIGEYTVTTTPWYEVTMGDEVVGYISGSNAANITVAKETGDKGSGVAVIAGTNKTYSAYGTVNVVAGTDAVEIEKGYISASVGNLSGTAEISQSWSTAGIAGAATQNNIPVKVGETLTGTMTFSATGITDANNATSGSEDTIVINITGGSDATLAVTGYDTFANYDESAKTLTFNVATQVNSTEFTYTITAGENDITNVVVTYTAK